MAIKKIQMIPPGYTDVVHPETAADNIIETDSKKVMTGDERTKLGSIPSDAVFTDTNTVTSINGQTGVITKEDIVALGIPAQDTVYTHPTTAGNKHIPTGGTVGQIMTNSASGTAVWGDQLSVVNGLAETVTGKVLDAVQGKALNDLVSTVSGDVVAHKAEKATKNKLGHVKIDNETIILNGNGEIEVRGYEPPPPIYGVEIDESNSNPETSIVYTDDAVGFVPAKGNNGAFSWGSWESIIKDEFGIRPVVLENLGGGNATVNYELQYDDYTKKADGSNSNLTDTDGDVMIEFGVPLWWKFTRVGNKLKIQLSPKEFDGAIKPAFEIEDGYNQVPIYPLFLTQVLYLLMFRNLDSQTALGRGNADGSFNYLNTGGTNAKTFNYGEITGRLQMKFLGMEDFWGNRRWWIDGCFYDANRNILIGKENFNDTGNGYENFGITSAANLNGYIDKVQGGNNTGFIPASTGGSEITYYSDYGYLSGGGLPYFGGNSGIGGDVGGFYLRSFTASASYASIGGRLFYSRNGKIYIGAYLGVSQSNKLRSISGQISHNSATIGAFRTLAKAND